MVVLHGSVNPQRQPVVYLHVLGTDGVRVAVDALLDSGFNGMLALPPSMVAELGLSFWFARRIILADGSSRNVDNFRGRILWEGVERPIRIIASGDQPLVGMALTYGYRIVIDDVDGGSVRVESL